MTAPAATPRGTPTGIPLWDGFSSKITFAANSTINFWEKTVKPPALDGGDPIDITTMFNVLWRTKAPRTLVDIPPISCKVAYDPAVYTQIQSIINYRTTVTITFPDGSTIAFYGYLQKFEPDDLQEGAQPEATVTIVPTNYDYTAKAEAGPTVTSVAGT